MDFVARYEHGRARSLASIDDDLHSFDPHHHKAGASYCGLLNIMNGQQFRCGMKRIHSRSFRPRGDPINDIALAVPKSCSKCAVSVYR